ncbi:SDR family oxidoreductase [Desulfogranum mediterraneum]|uniref:SDR family oxidoreductase n=1 Tax=Desulfogranum mediterraneum TaxID=160661 RepID=UPI000409283C|nr:SDR family oxidoreductase [Desulfogranum mediterraneum]
MPETMPATILITGATGYIGRRLSHRLLADTNHPIRILVRNRNKVQRILSEQVDIHEGDTFDREALSQALEGVDTAYYLIHSMGSTQDYQELDRRSAENFRDCCIASGVRRIIYLGGLGVKADASAHLLSRIETGEILSNRPREIQTIWLRAGVIIGSGSASFEIIRNLTQKLPLMITPSWVRTKTQPIGIDDVLAYLEGSLELGYEDNLVVDIGAEQLSFQEMMAQAAEVMGLKRLLIPVPLLSPRLSSYWLILFTPIPLGLAAALVEGLKSETILQNQAAAHYFPGIRTSSFRESVARALRELEQHQVLSRWCDSSGLQACDIKDFDDPSGAILRDSRTVVYTEQQEQEAVFQSACAIGGPNGWFRYNLLWQLRGLIDKIFGGYGLNRGRRLHRQLRLGDALDFWKVVDLKENKRLLLYAQMKLPGQAWLEFDVQPRQLVQTAHFIPRGLWGRLYWYAVYPFHFFVFTNLARTIVRAARTETKKPPSP